MNVTGSEEAARLRRITIGTIMAFTNVAVFCGNYLAVASFCINSKLHTVTNSFIVSMSVGDLLIALVCIPSLLLANLYGPQVPTGVLYCQFSISITVSLMGVAIGNLALNSFDRYRVILYPLKSDVTKRHVCWKIILAWLFAFVFGFLPYLGWGRMPNVRKTDETLYCQVRANLSWNYTLAFLCLAGTPFSLMGVAYWRILTTARRHTKVIAADAARFHGSKRADFIKETRAAKLVGAILGAFMICYLPLFVIVIVDLSTNELNSYAYVGGVLMATINSAINPFIMAAMNREYRNTFYRVARCRWRKTRD